MAEVKDAMLGGFLDELASIEKMGADPFGAIGKGIKGLFRVAEKGEGGLRDVWENVKNPIRGWHANEWAHPSHQHEMGEVAKKVLEKQQAGKNPAFFSGSAKHLVNPELLANPAKGLEMAKADPAKFHQMAAAPSKTMGQIWHGEGGVGSKAKETAEELSRRGWTTRGRVGKYIPLGQKSLMASTPLMGVPEIMHPEAPSPGVEGGLAENVMGDVGLGGTAGWLLGGGIKNRYALPLMFGMGYGGRRVGRAIDRLRGGADLKQAIG